MPPLRVDLDVVRAPHRVDRAVAARDRAEPRLRLALRHLVAPVDALPVRAVGRLEHELAADVRDVRVGEVAPRAARSASGAQVAFASEKATISPSVSRTARSCAATLPPRGLTISRTRGRRTRSTSSCVRSVEASEVTTSSSLLGRVVEREQVLEPPLDHGLLVVGGDDHRHRRLDRLLSHAPACARARARRRRAGRRRASRGARRARARRATFSSEHGASVDRPTAAVAIARACPRASASSSARGRTS